MAIDHFRKRRVQAELWNKDTKRRVGTVTLAGGKLEFEIPDEGDRQVVERAFQTGEIVSSWAQFGDHGLTENRATPLTPKWFRLVLLNVLAPRGYRYEVLQADDEDD